MPDLFPTPPPIVEPQTSPSLPHNGDPARIDAIPSREEPQEVVAAEAMVSSEADDREPTTEADGDRAAVEDDDGEVDQSPPLKGVGGWLMLFCVGLIAIAPIRTLGEMTTTWDQLKSAVGVLNEQVMAAAWIEFAMQIVILIYGVIVGALIVMGSDNGKRLAERYLIVRIVAIVVVELLLASLLLSEGLGKQAESEVLIGLFSYIALELFFFLVWFGYFKKSKRVAATYGT